MIYMSGNSPRGQAYPVPRGDVPSSSSVAPLARPHLVSALSQSQELILVLDLKGFRSFTQTSQASRQAIPATSGASSKS